jgi:hypothetical protein
MDRPIQPTIDPWNESDARADLQNAIDAALEKKRCVDESLRAAHSQHFELCRKNADLEHQIIGLRKRATEQHGKMKDLGLDHRNAMEELTESWEFRINELLMAIDLMRTDNAAV